MSNPHSKELANERSALTFFTRNPPAVITSILKTREIKKLNKFIKMKVIKLQRFKSLRFNLKLKKLVWLTFRVLFILTWIGARPVEDPYVLVGQLTTIIYFRLFSLWPFLNK